MGVNTSDTIAFPPILTFPHRGGRDPKAAYEQEFSLKLGPMGPPCPYTSIVQEEYTIWGDDLTPPL